MTSPPCRPALAAGRLPGPVWPDRPLQQVSIADLVAFCALVMEEPERFRYRRLEIAADELTPRQSAEVVSRILGRAVASGGRLERLRHVGEGAGLDGVAHRHLNGSLR